MADILANQGLRCKEKVQFFYYNRLPKDVRGELPMDKAQLPSFRRKYVGILSLLKESCIELFTILMSLDCFIWLNEAFCTS